MVPEGSPTPSIRTRIRRPDAGTVAAFRAISPTTLCDILQRDAVMDHGIRPLWPGIPRVAGPAFTVRCPAGDNLMVHAAIHRAEPGDVLVIQGGDQDFALSGGNVCAWAQRRGVAALVADGVVRDLAEVRERAFPVFARGVIPIPGAKEGPGEINGPLRCGGAAVYPGDIVVADEEGIVVVPLARAAEVLARAQAKAAADAAEDLEGWAQKHRGRTEAILKQKGCVADWGSEEEASMALNKGISITYCGHATFKITSARGKAVLIDPWLSSNPACPEELKRTDRLDLMLITHGHFDHIADAMDLGMRLKPRVLTVYEIGLWLEGKGVPNVTGMGRGGTVEVDGIRCTLVQAFHSSSIKDGTQVIYGGEPGGFVIQFENGFTIYHAGDTNVFGDMKIIADLYGPELVMLPIGDLYTMAPKEAAYACKLLNPKWVIPIHYGTFPALTGRPEQLRDLTKDLKLEVVALKPGETLS